MPRVPGQRDSEHHIAFLENQRNPKDKGALRIPGPRDFDRGDLPQTVDEDIEDPPLTRHLSSASETAHSIKPASTEHTNFDYRSDPSPDDHMKTAITIDEPMSPHAKTRTSSLKSMRAHALSRAPSFGGAVDRIRSRAGTFSSFLASQSNKEKEPMPYLSWTPTIGRNSAFVDLTEEQREELGGIEYRALKTLAIVLVGKFMGLGPFRKFRLITWARLNDPTVTVLPAGYRILDGWFQATSTRTAGFSVVNIADLHPAIQVSYMIMMYISVFPIAISVRRTNVYEEKSLGIYGSKHDQNEDDQDPSYVGAHLRRQLSFDLWYVFLGLFIIAIAEGNRIENTNDYAFTTFSVLFEIVSAYGTVGLSLGYPNVNASFSSQFKTVSKLVIVAMEIRGRHRGLPYRLDRAILLPSESLHAKEDQDARKRLNRRNSIISRAESTARSTHSTRSHTLPQDGPASTGVLGRPSTLKSRKEA
ncbi:MAG: hypothetical protein M1825_005924 [Sarcosagium campestre]|nr:MAG: hypothetical protein M1825_005924 [Sarcosagium campestre]